MKWLVETQRGNHWVLALFALAGLTLAVAGTRDPGAGTWRLLIVTAVESGAFVLIYGLRSSWRSEAAARAVFWLVASYFAVSAGTLALRLWPRESWAITGIREIGYLGLSVAFLNLLLTLIRAIRSSDDR
ncbi:hypothetical protein SPI1_20 [Skermania phage SPI1]|nr:hypothetical protein SPI1_20 [Skermania phage SPI1]